MRIYLNRERKPQKIAIKYLGAIYVFASVLARIQKLSYGISISEVVNASHSLTPF